MRTIGAMEWVMEEVIETYDRPVVETRSVIVVHTFY